VTDLNTHERLDAVRSDSAHFLSPIILHHLARILHILHSARVRAQMVAAMCSNCMPARVVIHVDSPEPLARL
jgi:hypothetical protein